MITEDPLTEIHEDLPRTMAGIVDRVRPVGGGGVNVRPITPNHHFHTNMMGGVFVG
jgi:hypothetical protein